jgi:hypothetical protein
VRLTHDDIRRACGAGRGQIEIPCPCCGNKHLTLFGKDDFSCKGGNHPPAPPCDPEKIAAEVRRRLDSGEIRQPAESAKPKKLRPSEQSGWQGFTLDDYCQLKKLDRRLLEYLFGASTVNRRGKPVVAWPYFSEDGKPLATKIRMSRDSHDTYFEPCDPHIPYGLNNPHLKNLIRGSYDLLITEGESDCHTFSCWGMVAIGISGGQGWLPEFAELPIVANAARILICEDQDEGGKKFTAKILKDIPHALVLRFAGVKDPSDLHVKYVDFEDSAFSPHPFVQCVDIAIQAATLERSLRLPRNQQPTPDAMREEAFYGLAGRVVRLLEPFMEADRAAILSNFLASSAVLFQHEAHCKVAADIHYPDDYFLTVGKSAISRKGTTTNLVLSLIEIVQPGFRDRVLRGLSTGQGLIQALIKKQPGNEDAGNETEAPSEAIAPAALVEISEFAELLAVMGREENTLSAVLRDAWDGKSLAVLTRKEPLRVTNVSLAQIAHITSAELTKKLTSTDRANGFANRFLFVFSKRAQSLPNPDTSRLDCTVVAEEIRAALSASKNLGEIHRDDSAALLWNEEYKRLTTRGETMVDSLLSRAEAHVLRLSLLYALLDSSPVIRREHLRAALAFWDYAEASVRYVFGNAIEPEDEKILRRLENGPLTTGEIRRQIFGDNQSSEWVAERMAALQQQRKVRACEKESKRGMWPAWELVA